MERDKSAPEDVGVNGGIVNFSESEDPFDWMERYIPWLDHGLMEELSCFHGREVVTQVLVARQLGEGGASVGDRKLKRLCQSYRIERVRGLSYGRSSSEKMLRIDDVVRVWVLATMEGIVESEQGKDGVDVMSPEVMEWLVEGNQERQLAIEKIGLG